VSADIAAGMDTGAVSQQGLFRLTPRPVRKLRCRVGRLGPICDPFDQERHRARGHVLCVDGNIRFLSMEQGRRCNVVVDIDSATFRIVRRGGNLRNQAGCMQHRDRSNSFQKSPTERAGSTRRRAILVAHISSTIRGSQNLLFDGRSNL
jgi:hypothetical protein